MSEITRIILIRHGQSEGNAENRFGGHLPIGLSSLGRLEAEATAKALANDNINAIYSSDLERAVETALPLAQLKGLSINKTPAFRERNVGVLQGLTFEDASEKFSKEYDALLKRDFDYVIKEGESYKQVLERASSELNAIVEKHRGERVCIFTHTGTISILTLHLLGALDGPVLKPVWIATANCSITRFTLRDNGFVILKSLNDTRHLAGLYTGEPSFGFGYKS
jgi:broad specificity phosphatase PhoE